MPRCVVNTESSQCVLLQLLNQRRGSSDARECERAHHTAETAERRELMTWTSAAGLHARWSMACCMCRWGINNRRDMHAACIESTINLQLWNSNFACQSLVLFFVYMYTASIRLHILPRKPIHTCSTLWPLHCMIAAVLCSQLPQAHPTMPLHLSSNYIICMLNEHTIMYVQGFHTGCHCRRGNLTDV